jgi:bromodomain-containing factor 1
MPKISKSQSTTKVPFFLDLTLSGLNLLDYPTIIKNPMDLGTVKKKLKAGKYKSMNEYQDDILLIWDNCKRYNQEGSVN